MEQRRDELEKRQMEASTNNQPTLQVKLACCWLLAVSAITTKFHSLLVIVRSQRYALKQLYYSRLIIEIYSSGRQAEGRRRRYITFKKIVQNLPRKHLDDFSELLGFEIFNFDNSFKLKCIYNKHVNFELNQKCIESM